jgi:hypothetical protein
MVFNKNTGRIQEFLSLKYWIKIGIMCELQNIKKLLQM